MPGVPQWAEDLGWWAVFLFLLLVVFLRAQATYWVGRGARSGAGRTKWRDRFSSAGMRRAEDFLTRWGPVGVPVSFLTVGFQTLVNAAAGFTKMRWPLYTAVMIPGCAAWAAIYTAAIVAASNLFKLYNVWAGVIIIALALGIWALVALRGRKRDAAGTVT